MAAARQQRDDRGRGGTGPGRLGSSRRRQETRRSVRPGFSHEKALIFGVIQVLAGIAALILGVVSISTRAWGYYYAAGFWSGTLFFVSGVFGLASARRKSNCTIVTFMVFSAMSAILALVTLTLSAIGVATENMLFQHQHQQSGQSNALAVHSLIIVVSVIAAVCGTASSIVGCRAVCGVWYLPDNPYHSADLQTPTSAEFSGFRQNSNLQYLIDPDLRSQAQHLFAAGAMGDGRGIGGTASICPPASYEYPTPAVVAPPPPPSGPQQIAILAPAADGSVYGIVQASSDQAGGISQVMYIMPNTEPCPQPGAIAESIPEPPVTPPPSYSQINLTTVGLDESAESAFRESIVNTSRDSGEQPAVFGSVVNTDTSAANTTLPVDVPFPAQLPPLDRLLPLNGVGGTRTAPLRPHRSSSNRPTSLISSRTSGTQTSPAVGGGGSGASTSGGHQANQRSHRPASSSQRHSVASTDSHHHRRPGADCRGAESGLPVTCHRHSSQSVGTQAGAQSRSSGGGGSRSASSRYHSSRGSSCAGGESSSSGNVRSSRSSSHDQSHPTRDRHKPGEVHSSSRDPEQGAESGQPPVGHRISSHTHHRSSSSGVPQCSGSSSGSGAIPQSHWRHSGSFFPANAIVTPAGHPQELLVTSFQAEVTTSDPNSGHRRWVSPSQLSPPLYSSDQTNNLSPMNSVL